MDETTSAIYRYGDKFFSYWQATMIGRLLSAKVWKSVKDGYIPPKRVKSPAQKEARRNNALALEIIQKHLSLALEIIQKHLSLALEIIQKHLSKAMRNKMETITSAKELWLSLE